MVTKETIREKGFRLEKCTVAGTETVEDDVRNERVDVEGDMRSPRRR